MGDLYVDEETDQIEASNVRQYLQNTLWEIERAYEALERGLYDLKTVKDMVENELYELR